MKEKVCIAPFLFPVLFVGLVRWVCSGGKSAFWPYDPQPRGDAAVAREAQERFVSCD